MGVIWVEDREIRGSEGSALQTHHSQGRMCRREWLGVGKGGGRGDASKMIRRNDQEVVQNNNIK